MTWDLLEEAICEALRKNTGTLYVTDLRPVRTSFGPMLIDPIASVLAELELLRP